MKKSLIFFTICIGTLTSAFSKNRDTKFLITAHKPDGIYLLDSTGKTLWKQNQINHPQGVDFAENGAIFCSELFGAKMINRDHSIAWEYKSKFQNPVAQVLENGRFLVGLEGVGKLAEINENGEIEKTVQLDSKNQQKHGQFRFCQKTETGTYLVPLTAEGLVKEYKADGSVVQILEILKTCSAIRLKMETR